MTIVPGMDVSRYQGTVNWQAVADAGFRFAVVRATIWNAKIDETFETNLNGARNAGLLVSAYHVVKADVAAAAQIDFFAQALAGHKWDLPPVLDIERDDNLTSQQITPCVRDCLHLSEQRFGRKPIVYNTANLTVNAALVAPAIVTQPASQTVNSGANVSFSVTATGSAPLTYQWRFNGSNINNATNSTYSISNVQSSHAGQYSVRVTNAAGNVTSANATLTVNIPPGSNGPTDCVPPAGHAKTVICHVPPGDPDNGTTLSVGGHRWTDTPTIPTTNAARARAADIKLINNQIATRRQTQGCPLR